MDKLNRSIGYDSPKVKRIPKFFMFINIFAIAMDGPHRDQGEAGHPEERGLARERGQWISRV